MATVVAVTLVDAVAIIQVVDMLIVSTTAKMSVAEVWEGMHRRLELLVDMARILAQPVMDLEELEIMEEQMIMVALVTLELDQITATVKLHFYHNSISS